MKKCDLNLIAYAKISPRRASYKCAKIIPNFLKQVINIAMTWDRKS